MGIRIMVAVLFAGSLFLIMGINPFKPLMKLKNLKNKRTPRKMTAKEFVVKLDGKKRENVVRKNFKETKNSLTTIGQADRYQHTVRCAIGACIGGGLLSFLLFKSILVTVVVGGGCLMLPLWFTKISVYNHTAIVNEQLETSLSMVTTAYSRHKNIVTAVEGSLPHMQSPVREVFQNFVTTIQKIDVNRENAILQMKNELDNVLFHQWCDILYLCQADSTMISALHPIVTKISDLKMQQAENKTQMMMPLRNILMMVGITCSAVPILYLMMPDWYWYITNTIQGQVVLCIVAIIIFTSIHKAIDLSKPIDYRI